MLGMRTFPWKSFQLALSLYRFRFHLHQLLVNNLPTFDEIFCHAPLDKSLFRPLNLSRINEARFTHGPVGLVEHVCRMYSHLDVNMNTDRDTNINTNTDTVMNNMGEKAWAGLEKRFWGNRPAHFKLPPPVVSSSPAHYQIQSNPDLPPTCVSLRALQSNNEPPQGTIASTSTHFSATTIAAPSTAASSSPPLLYRNPASQHPSTPEP
ncbi:GD23829 [Drosophila simulans]|uniref:GD23829 n=1 Tax=Drosophila simulans TaxID=7240 RepID=B4Q3S1_DROSI|nr:GD23829 [Drosophila simulans]